MRNEAVLKKIDSMAETFGRRLTAAALENYLDVLDGIHPDTILSACKNWMKAESKMPSPSDIRKRAQDIDKYYDKKAAAPVHDLRCRYYSTEESIYSKSLCKKDATEEDAQFSRLQFGEVYCNWHYACAYAKAFPESNTATFVKDHLKSTKKTYVENAPTVTQAARSIAQAWNHAALNYVYR